MKIGWDLKRGLNRRLTAWKRWDDPSPGDFSCGVVMGVVPELVMWRNGSQLYQRSPWNGVLLGGKNTSVFGLQFIVNQDEVVYTSQVQDKSVITRVVLNQTNYHRERYLLDPKTQTWNLYSTVPKDNCDSYNPCGPNGNCVATDSPRCHCLAGFDPKSVDSYNALDWAQGCVRTEGWICGVKNKDGFRKFSGLKVPDTAKSWGDSGMGIEDCRDKCWKNCSCTAYSNMYFGGGGSGCLLWFGDLLDLRVATVPGQDLYVRMAVSDTGMYMNSINFISLISRKILCFCLFMLSSFRLQYNEDDTEKITTNNRDEGEQEDLELPYFDLPTIVQATNDFSSDNKLGQGGFGPVYKGTLGDGQEIAVKRLSQSSGQGLQEFKNEVIMCAKLQHRNLVKVLGCCIEGTEKMLVYEYMPNKSLDSVLFGCPQNKSLNWTQRFHVIFGIARGLLYLHQDSRLRIIHRDLKASNVLLDRELNPKISDFGMARMFRGDQIEGNTNRVVGTYGYMAPEYAVHGLFSTKSDVFSFGVLLLEIISGKKNRGASYPNYGFNLIGHAWKLWNEGNTKELVDSSLGDAFNLLEVLRCIHVSLLCMQQHPEDRPNMDLVLVMLSSECNLPQPKEPGFLIEKTSIEGEYSSNKQMMFSSSNEITMTLLQAR
ncbi:G-type lectin S-receptor-like serine/threonine-protein kinase [Senna tora]|uniref:non-specific serine/threonine protein kinase n=1 Tax=Senna tora TaxID=362788 RepID=A0A834TVV3_9FABA|nr:G-type lectin S-receptor-like serine/threonine-protein kinase [Senna tora]